MSEIELLTLEEIKLNQHDDLTLNLILNHNFNENLKYINDYIDLINNSNNINNNINNSNNNSNKNNKKTKITRQRQLKINEASKRCRRRKKEHMQIMSNHIKTLHNIISNLNLHNEELQSEILKFDKNILI